MAYGSDAEDEGLGASDMDPGTAGGDTEQDEAVSNQYSSFESGFNAAAANTAGSNIKAAPSNIGSQKSPSTKAGQNVMATNRGPDKVTQGFGGAINIGPLSAREQQQALSQKALDTVDKNAPAWQDPDKVGKQSPLGSGGKPYDTLDPNYEAWIDRALDWTDYKQAGKDRDKYGEFNQAGFAANINNIENPTASRTGLDFDMASSIATNPLGRWSSGPEKGMAAAQMAMPFGVGTVLGGLRTLGYMYGTGKPGEPAQPTEDANSSPLKSKYKAPKVQTTTALNKPTLNISRNKMRSAQSKVTRRI